MKAPFRTSFGTVQDREITLVRLRADGVEGWGELVAEAEPLYSEETAATAWQIMRRHLLPLVLGEEFSHPAQLAERWSMIRRNYMAKAAIELAFWDAWSGAGGVSLSEALGGGADAVAAGVSIGIQNSIPELLAGVGRFIEQGYGRIKVKIEPGWDLEAVTALREEFGDVPLMVDANSAYTLDDIAHLRGLDEFGLMMIEQPLAHDDIVDHVRLQAELETPICLDESIHSADDARRALDLGACRIINIKTGRVGGHSRAVAVHDLCLGRGVPVWCGGMLESGIGRLHNIALASLPGFTLPGDTSASDRYWEEDIIDPPVTLRNGMVAVPTEPGLGHRVRTALIERLTVDREEFRRGKKV